MSVRKSARKEILDSRELAAVTGLPRAPSPRSVREDTMKLPRVSLVSIEFVIVVLAVNFGVMRALYDSFPD